jgi:hypothetical protein
MQRARVFIPQSGFHATRFSRWSVERLPNFWGEERHRNRIARIPPYGLARLALGGVLKGLGIDLESLRRETYGGVEMPSSCTVLGYQTAKEVGLEYFEMLSKQVRSFDGDLDTLAPYDFVSAEARARAGGQLTTRMFNNLIASMPITQQQAALNMALLVHCINNPDSPAAVAANALAYGVGERWGILPSATPALFGMNSLNSSTGLVHLFEDVPQAVTNFLRDNLPRNLSREEAIHWVHVIAGACELAKQSAIGALDGTQEYMDGMSDNLPLLTTNVPYLEGFSLMGARVFFTQPYLEGAIVVRNKYTLDAVHKILAERGQVIAPEQLSAIFEEGAKEVMAEALEVKATAESTSGELARANIEAAESEF